MNFSQALVAMENGQKVRRQDWRFLSTSFLQLLPINDAKVIYIQGQHWTAPTLLESYGFSYDDVKSETWEVVK